MTVLAVVTVLVGLVAVLNLILTVGLVRRIREHTLRLAELAAVPTVEVALPPGAEIEGFSAITTTGSHVDSSELDRVLVGVFSPHCSACEVSLPRFAEAAGKPSDVPFLAVIAAREQDGLPLLERLPQTAAAIVELDGGPVQQSLGVTGYPAFLLIEQGVVRASSHDLAVVLEQAVPAP